MSQTCPELLLQTVQAVWSRMPSMPLIGMSGEEETLGKSETFFHILSMFADRVNSGALSLTYQSCQMLQSACKFRKCSHCVGL